jgi:hypothetical protein
MPGNIPFRCRKLFRKIWRIDGRGRIQSQRGTRVLPLLVGTPANSAELCCWRSVSDFFSASSMNDIG